MGWAGDIKLDAILSLFQILKHASTKKYFSETARLD